jgi:dTDP-4-dehydrorhamnose 3,5-epimerase-like enzyme
MSIHETAVVAADTVQLGDVAVGPYAVVGIDTSDNDDRPVVIHGGTSVASHAVVNRGVVLGAGCQILPSAVVHDNVPENAVVGGNPARIVGYRDPIAAGRAPLVDPARGDTEVPVEGVSLIPFQVVTDLRGALRALECDHLPFAVRRVFTVSEVPNGDLRGAHAHRKCHQLLWCVSGSLRCLVDDGRRRAEVLLGPGGMALHMPPGIWGTQYRYERDTVLNVAASLPYDAEDYIRDYASFLEYVGVDGSVPSSQEH